MKGLAVLDLGHAGGVELTYNQIKCERILSEFRRSPDRKKNGTATLSLKTLQQALRQAPDDLPEVISDNLRFLKLCQLKKMGFEGQFQRDYVCKTTTAVTKQPFSNC